MREFGICQLNLTAATFRFTLHDQRGWNNARFVVCDIIIHVRVPHACFFRVDARRLNRSMVQSSRY